MAHAQNNTKVETITQTTGSVKLSLSLREAEFLAQVLNNIGGCPRESARKHAAAISEALTQAGVRSANYSKSAAYHSIYFDTQPEVLNAER